MLRPQYTFARRMRSDPTASESLLWQALRRNQLDGLTFRRQHVIPAARFIADFCCPALKLIIEIDGGYHEAVEQAERDQEREMLVRELGYTFVRFTDEQILNDLPGALRTIQRSAEAASGAYDNNAGVLPST